MNRTITIATAPSRKSAKWRNQKMTWSELLERLSGTARTKETIKQYLAMTKQRQGEIKDVGGFVGGYLKGGQRKNGSVQSRQVLCLDADYGGITEVWGAVEMLGLEAALYTTHKHTPASPRFRLIILMGREASPEEYEAAARVVASWIGIDYFDDTTYQPARLMYWPSTSADGEFIYRHSEGAPLDVDGALDSLPDWRDPTTWPVSSRFVETVRPAAGRGKAEDPTTKEGVVGAFCRAYRIEDAIEEQLSDVYVPCPELGEGRYTYIGGSTAGGLVTYDGLFGYSYHSTDPAGGRIVNAFDLVRIHRFGDMDEGRKDDSRSCRAMADFANTLPAVRRELVESRRREAQEDFAEPDIADTPPAEEEEGDDWKSELETEGKRGAIKNSIENVVKIITHDRRLRGRLCYNELAGREEAIAALPWDAAGLRYPRGLTDADDAQIRLFLEVNYGITARPQIADAVTAAAHRKRVHPIRKYLDGCEWDGAERLDRLLVDCFGAEDTPYTRTVTRKAFTAAVARVYEPGRKFDNMLVLVGEQGTGKSTLLARMGREWFSDSVYALGGKEAMEAIQGRWIIEMAELAGLRKAEVETVKYFISKCEDDFREAYARRKQVRKRSCVFFGTTNEPAFLRDTTGNRRFWPVDCMGRRGRVTPAEYLTDEVVGQLWAEARHHYQEGEPLYLESESVRREAAEIQAAHMEWDERTDIVAAYLNRLVPPGWETYTRDQQRAWLADEANEGTEIRKFVRSSDLWEDCFGSFFGKGQQRELAAMVKNVPGWKAGSDRIEGAQVRGYARDVLRMEGVVTD